MPYPTCPLYSAGFTYNREMSTGTTQEELLTDTLAHLVNHHRLRRDAGVDDSLSEEEESSQEDSDDIAAISPSRVTALKQDPKHDHDANDSEEPQAGDANGNVKMVSQRTIIIKTQTAESGFDESVEDESENDDDESMSKKFNTDTKPGGKGSDAASNLDKTASKEEGGDNSTGKYSGSPQAQRMSVKPSMQLIGIVVGVVLSSVFITGFIRWRVKKHLYAKRLRKLAQAEKYSTFKNIVRQQAGLMDTIYESEETHESHAHQVAANGAARGGKQRRTRPWGSRWSFLRFIICGETQKRCGSMRKESDRLALRRRPGLNRVVVKEWDITVPRSPSSHNESMPGRAKPDHREDGHGDNTISVPLLRHGPCHGDPLSNHGPCHGDPLSNHSHSHGDPRLNHAPSNCTSVSTSSPSLAPPAVVPVRRSPSPGRTAMSSILNTVFSFHRDWVGRRWLERHNLSISGILHGNENNSQRHLERTTAEIPLNSEECMSCSSVSDVSASGMSTEGGITTQLNNESWDSAYSLNSYHTVNSNVDGQIAEAHYSIDTDDNDNFTSYSSNVNLSRDTHEASMTSFSSHVVNASYMLQNQTQPKYSLSRAPTPLDFRNPMRQLSPLNTDYNYNFSANGGRFRSFSLPVTNLLLDPGRLSSAQPKPQSHVGAENDNQYSNSQYYLSSPMSDEFSHQSGVVLEQLSDGSKIIFVPPPFLPSYHNDKPPPYQ
ncbi:hypothetical protein Btru_029885 [Bulinus truncatus]|nr:hypothetical protein Btru_029885 [Bulinus truncatus]